MPSALAPRKRRRPSILRTDAVGQPPVAKRMRVTLEDVEMADVNNASCGQRKSRSRRRKVLLRDVLRKEKFSRAYWQQVVVQGSNVNAAHSNSAVQHPAQEIRGAEASEAGDRGAHDFLREDETKLTGEEEVCEVIDASENVEPNANFGAGYQSAAFGGPAAEPSVQAVLLDNGLCAVQITRADGSTQSVIIQPPESGDDVW